MNRFAAIVVTLILAAAGSSFAQFQIRPPKPTDPRPLGTVIDVSTLACPSGGMTDAACQQMTVTCPDVADVYGFVKVNTPPKPIGTVLYLTGGDGDGLYDTQFTYGLTAVQNVYNAGFTTVQISFNTPFITTQPSGWAEGPGGMLAVACRFPTMAQWIYTTIQNNSSLPMCTTGNSGGAGAIAYALSNYGSGNILAMAEVTAGPPTARMDWGCMCQEGKLPTTCGQGNLGTCFGKVDAAFWDPAYTPNTYCSSAVEGDPPPGGATFFLDDSVEAPNASYNFSRTFLNVVFGGEDTSSAVAIGLDWYDKIISNKAQSCVPDGPHPLPDVLDGAQQIANDLISMCKTQPSGLKGGGGFSIRVP